MNLAELFVAIGIKIENIDQLAALETLLRNVTAQARAAVQAINAVNGVSIAPPAVTPVAPATPNAPAGPATPNAPIPINAPPNKVVTWAKAVRSLSEQLNKLAVIVASVSAGMIVMISRAVKATMQMANFGEATGLSTDRLQQFMHAAQVGGASGKEMIGLLETLQSKQAAIALGEGDLSPFAFFGIDPTQDTNKVIDDLRSKLKTFTREQLFFARTMAERMGIGRDMFAALRRESTGLNKAFIMSQESIDSITDLNKAWNNLLFQLDAVRNLFVSAIAPVLEWVARQLSKIVKPLGVFVQWMNSGSKAGNAMRYTLGALVVVLGAIAAIVVVAAGVVASIASVMGIAAIATTGFGAAVVGTAGAVVAFLGPVLAVIAVLSVLGLLMDEIYTSLNGGKTILGDFGEWIAEKLIVPLVWLYDTFKSIGDIVPDWLKGLFGGKGASVSVNPMQTIAQAAAQPPSNQPGGAGSTNQTNDIQINVDGSKDPRATGSAVLSALSKSYAETAYQMPAMGY